MIAAVITTLDNCPVLRAQLPVLRRDLAPYEHRIIVVNNGSRDDTREFLDDTPDVEAIHRTNLGAGPGRNTGLDAAAGADYYFLLDGGITPMINSIPVMLDFLERHPDTDVIAPPWENFVAEYSEFTRRLPFIDESTVYSRSDLSMTAYCLARRAAFEPHRFSEEGPFGEPGWGVDDNEMAGRWWRAGVSLEVFGNGRPLRRPSGSFQRLYEETGIWPNQYGSVYEKRFVKYQQDYPDHWDNGIEETLIIESGADWRAVARLVNAYRRETTVRRHEIIVVAEPSPEMDEFVFRHALRQHHGDTTLASDGTILRRPEHDEDLWCGNFLVARDLDAALRMRFQEENVWLGDVTTTSWTPLTAGDLPSPRPR